ncbi:MAG: polymerase-binding transcription factor DksA [Pseudomonadota bacterium]|jgi:DnaK suppressor protein
MKTVAKKAVKKAPSKAATKTSSKAVAKVVKKVATKKAGVAVKAALKPVPKPAAKPAVKASAKLASKPTIKKAAKPAVKAATKPLPKAAAKVAVKAAAKVASKPAVKAANQALTKTKSKAKQPIQADTTAAKKKIKKADAVPVAPKEVKTAKPAKSVKALAVKASEKSNTVTKPSSSPEELNLKQSMVIASKIVPPEIKDSSSASPAQSKAKTSRLASLTVPSMAQTVASTAAKSSYGPHVPSLAIIPPPQFAPKQNPKLANNWKTKTAEEMTDEEVLAMPDSEYMNIKQMNYFRLKLLQLKAGILASAGATTEHLRDESAVVPDPTDRATIEEEHALELRTRDRERKLLKKIEQSIVRIDAGDYGYCDETGEAIGVGRLLARPTATLSLEAQQRRELKQKMFGD